MLGCGGGAIDFLGGMEDFEGEYGEAVDHEAGSFGMQRELGVELRERVEQIAVEVLGEVVAELVELVDGALAGGDGLVAGERVAGSVFAMPEIEVGAMLVKDELVEMGICEGARRGRVMPEERGVIVQADDLWGF